MNRTVDNYRVKELFDRVNPHGGEVRDGCLDGVDVSVQHVNVVGMGINGVSEGESDDSPEDSEEVRCLCLYINSQRDVM